MLFLVHKSLTVPNILKNDWLTWFLSEMTATRFPPWHLFASIMRLVCLNRNFTSTSLTGSILQSKVGPPKILTIKKRNTVFARRCGLLTALPNKAPPWYCKVILTYSSSNSKMRVFWRGSERLRKILCK